MTVRTGVLTHRVVFFPRPFVFNLAHSKWGFGADGRYAVCTKLPCLMMILQGKVFVVFL